MPLLTSVRGGASTVAGLSSPLAHLDGDSSAAKAVIPQARGGATAAAPSQGGLMQTLKVGSFFFLWYAFNIGYNIYNKKALNALPLPWLVGLAQLSLGLLYVFPLWLTGLRKVSNQKGGVDI